MKQVAKIGSHDISPEKLAAAVKASRSFSGVLLTLRLNRRANLREAVRRAVLSLGIDTSHFTSRCKQSLDEVRSARIAGDKRAYRLRRGDVSRAILEDSRRSDAKDGRRHHNDLTTEFIREIISDGCSYCGETSIRMTLDRIDNALGHSSKNVVAACIRCNLVRRDMPHEAWLVIARAMKKARRMGLFGDWKCMNR